jgi:hypothetical protein
MQQFAQFFRWSQPMTGPLAAKLQYKKRMLRN